MLRVFSGLGWGLWQEAEYEEAARRFTIGTRLSSGQDTVAAKLRESFP